MDYTVIGDNVNIIARIEAMNSKFNTPILFSESTWPEVRGMVETDYIDEVVLRGRSEPTKLYTVK